MSLGGSIAREAVVMLAAAVVVAYVLGELPELRAWIERKRTGRGCSC